MIFANIVMRIKPELVKNINLRGLNAHECKISKVRTRKQVENEGVRKPKDRASFQVSVGSKDGTWYAKDFEHYSATLSIIVRNKVAKDEVLNRIIKELGKLIALK